MRSWMALDTRRPTGGLSHRACSRESEGYMKSLFVRLPRLIIGLLLLVAVGINFANVVARYMFRTPLIWAEEILIFIMIWSIFIGIILVTVNQAHLKMDVFAVSLPEGVAKLIAWIVLVVTILVSVVIVISSSTVLITLGSYDQRSIVAEVPMVIPHLAIPIGFGAIGLLHLARLLKFGRKDREGGAHD
jgi:TRAP-type C4-dicarboxylate transport system permease small subunit